MLLKRKIQDELAEWKKMSDGRSALLVEGARRVGKSTAVEAFGKEAYRSYILIDFEKASRAIRENFENNLSDLDTFFQVISLEYQTRLYRRGSLIIFDEVQKFPKAREAIKYLVADGRYDFIETGSLISIKENVENIVIPSEEDKVFMHPLDFEEFAWALNEDLLLEYIDDCWQHRIALESSIHQRASRLFYEYMLVGGMPQSVLAYRGNDKSFFEADKAKRRILSLYRDDIGKAARRYRSKVSAVFEGIPGFLSTHEKKVVLSKIDEGKTFDQYDDPLFWLGDSMICNTCYKCTDPNVGLALNRDDSSVKCYMGDTGLLVSLAFSENEATSSDLYRRIMSGKLSLNKGMLYENVIAQMLTAKGKKLYFYTHYSVEKHRNDIEMDFLVSNESAVSYRVSPIEVKSSKNYTTTSYSAFKTRFGKRIGDSYIVHPKTFQIDEGEYKIPAYMFFCLFREETHAN